MNIRYFTLYFFLMSSIVCFGQNQYLPNGDFCEDMSDWKINYGDAQKVKLLPIKDSLFERALEIDARESNAISIESKPFKIDNLYHYRFSAMVKRLEGRLGYNITLHWLDINKKYIGREYAHVGALVGVDWVPWKIEAIAPEEAKFGRIKIELPSGWGCQIANVQVEKIESTGPKLAIDFIPEAIRHLDPNFNSNQYARVLKIRFENRGDVILENIGVEVKLSNKFSDQNGMNFKKGRLSYAQDFIINIPLKGNIWGSQSQVEVTVNCRAENKKVVFKAKDTLFVTHVSEEVETDTKNLPLPTKPDTQINLGCYYFPVMLDWSRNNWGVRQVEYMEPRLGYYNESLSEVADWHIYWAVNHGMSFFVFDWYYNQGMDYLNDALDDGFLKSRFREQMKFCLDWCNEGHCGQFKQVDFGQKALESFTTTICQRYFKHSNYLLVDDKPVVIIHMPVRLINAYGGYEGCCKSLDMMRSIARNYGYKGVYFVALQNNLPYLFNYAAAGFDCVTSYAYGFRDVPVDWKTRTLPYEALIPRHRESFAIARQEAHEQHIDYIPSAWVGWDDNARSKEKAVKTQGNSPGALRRMVQMLSDYVEPDTKLALLEAWNEWGEGGNVEPDKFYGFTRLAAIKDAITKDHGPYKIAVPTKREIKNFNTSATWADVHNMYLQRYAKTLGLNNGINMDFSSSNDLCFSTGNNILNPIIEDGSLRFFANGSDPILLGPPFMELPAGHVQAVEFRMKSANGHKGQLFWRNSPNSIWTEKKSQYFKVIADGQWHNYHINLYNHDSWRGVIQQFRFDPTDATSKIEVDFFKTVLKPTKKMFTMKNKLKYRIALMGCPSNTNVEWSLKNLRKLKNLGFNTIQLNIAWGCRPADEPLNLEDVVALKKTSKKYVFRGLMPYRADNSPERRAQRKEQLKHRIQLCKKMGMRTLFHFGAPNNICYSLGNTIDNKMPLCLSDPNCTNYYIDMLTEFAAEYPEVDDILVYTYDQDAWLCNEFGNCPACRGIPVHKRVVPFINALGRQWEILNKNGRLWWEPWELSAGQVCKSIEILDPESVSLMLHSNIAEVQVTMPVDRWFKNACYLAKQRGIEVCAECYLGAPSEELEPFNYLSFPQVTLRQLKAVSAVDGLCGIKEYFGTIPSKWDINLLVTSLFFENHLIDEKQAMDELSKYYDSAAEDIKKFWTKCSEAMELFPWDTSWYIREIGRSNINHSMSAAFLRGQQCHTPSWFSTRAAIFMKTDSIQPDPWMLEDVQLRCEMAADRMSEAIEIGYNSLPQIPEHLQVDFNKGLKEWEDFKKRALSYAYHLRETNLAELMRKYRHENKDVPQRIINEMLNVMQLDLNNQNQCKELQTAIRQLQDNLDIFLDNYFCIENEDNVSKGHFSVTSR